MNYKKSIILFFFLSGIIGFLYADELVSSVDSPDVLRSKLVLEAKKYVGVPYLYGGMTSNGMDCSGFIYTVARQSIQFQLPRTVAAMWNFCTIISDSDKEPGDILFFKTVGNKVSHAGIYIGNNKFIHSASDGPNTGVIVSSLNQTTWKKTYAGCGRFLPSSRNIGQDDSKKAKNIALQKNEHNSTTTLKKTSFFSYLNLDISAHMVWNFFSERGLLFNVRGASISAHTKYTKYKIQPGFGIEVRIEPVLETIQFPLFFSLSVPHGFRVYAGPVFTIGRPRLKASREFVAPSIFPGIIGVSWESPALQLGIFDFRFVQDISWVVFNNLDNSALVFNEAAAMGLVFSTGVRMYIRFHR